MSYASGRSKNQVCLSTDIHLRVTEHHFTPDAFYGVEDANLHDVDVMTDISMAPTAFTRYTQAPSSVSRTTSKYACSALTLIPRAHRPTQA